MHKILIIITLIFTASFMGCTNVEKSGKEPVISVSILPLKYFVDKLTDNSIEVNVMVPQGASHGTYSPTPRQMQKLSDSDIYIRISSLGYEQAFNHRLKEMNSRMMVVELTSGIDLIRGVVVHGDHVHEGGIDPHIWMSPRVVLSILPVIRDALLEAYPQSRLVIEENYPALLNEIQSINDEFEELVPTLSQRRFLIFHPALSYLARDYGLEQLSIEQDGKEPSPSQLMDMVNQARAQSVPVIFIQEEYDQRNASLVSSETGAQVVQINPLIYDWPQGMRQLIETFSLHMR